MAPLLLGVLLASAPAELAVLSKDVAASTLEVRWQPLGAPAPVEPFARLEASADETFTGVVLPGARAVAVVRVPAEARDLSFAATLTLVAPGRPERTLATGVVRASRPHLLAGRLFIERGVAGPVRPDGEYRVDTLTLSEVDVVTGRLRAVFETRGYWAHLAGGLERELIVYVAGPEGARLLAVHVDTLAVRTLVPSMPALAHDFAVDAAGKAVLFTIAEPGVERWFVERLDLSTLRRARLAEGDSVALLPTVLPGGAAWAPRAGAGLKTLGKDSTALPPRGPGFERVRVVAAELVIARHEVPGEPPWAYVVRADAPEKLVPVAFPKGAIVDVAGVHR